MNITYGSNNSGGRWWLSDNDWKNLEHAGWDVDWVADDPAMLSDDGRWLGALATRATLKNVTMEEAIESFERVTGQDANAIGCECCGRPHGFEEDDEA